MLGWYKGRVDDLGLSISALNSEGMKRLTPAATAASINGSWVPIARVGKAEMTASWPCSAAVRSGVEL